MITKFITAAALCFWLAIPAVSQDPNPAQVEVLAQTETSWDGTRLPKYPQGHAVVTILRITIPPHTSLPIHKHLVINAGVLLKGELTVVSESGLSLHLKAGDSIVELVNQWHYGVNDGNEPAEIIVFYAGERGRPNTVQVPALQF